MTGGILKHAFAATNLGCPSRDIQGMRVLAGNVRCIVITDASQARRSIGLVYGTNASIPNAVAGAAFDFLTAWPARQ